MSQQDMIRSLRDLAFSLGEYPADWPDDLLVEAEQFAAMVKGCAQTERLTRALTAEAAAAGRRAADEALRFALADGGSNQRSPNWRRSR